MDMDFYLFLPPPYVPALSPQPFLCVLLLPSLLSYFALFLQVMGAWLKASVPRTPPHPKSLVDSLKGHKAMDSSVFPWLFSFS